MSAPCPESSSISDQSFSSCQPGVSSKSCDFDRSTSLKKPLKTQPMCQRYCPWNCGGDRLCTTYSLETPRVSCTIRSNIVLMSSRTRRRAWPIISLYTLTNARKLISSTAPSCWR